MTPEPGTLSRNDEGTMLIQVEAECYQLPYDDMRTLLIYGREVPITQCRDRKTGNKKEEIVVSIEGHAAANRSGKAIVLFTRAGHFIIPRVSFLRVARGEAVSAPLFPLIPDPQGGSG